MANTTYETIYSDERMRLKLIHPIQGTIMVFRLERDIDDIITSALNFIAYTFDGSRPSYCKLNRYVDEADRQKIDAAIGDYVLEH